MRVRVTVIVEPEDGAYFCTEEGGYQLIKRIERAVLTDEDIHQEGRVGRCRFHGEVAHAQKINSYTVGER